MLFFEIFFGFYYRQKALKDMISVRFIRIAYGEQAMCLCEKLLDWCERILKALDIPAYEDEEIMKIRMRLKNNYGGGSVH